MGCSCAKLSSAKIVKANKIAEKKISFIKVNKKKDEDYIKTIILQKRNVFYVLQKKTWIIILNFLPYKDLCQVGQLNKFLNKLAKSQPILMKFYKNKRSSQMENTNSQVTNHYNYTTINTYNNYSKINNENKRASIPQISVSNYKSNTSSPLSRSKSGEFFIGNNCEETIVIKRSSFQIPTLKVDDWSSNRSFKSSKSNHVLVCSPKLEFELRPDDIKPNGAAGLKVFINELESSYIDLFSKREIELKNDLYGRSVRSDSIEHINLVSSGKFSNSDLTDATPSFRQDNNWGQSEEAVEVCITNIIQHNMPLPESITTKDKYLNVTNKISDGRYFSEGP